VLNAFVGPRSRPLSRRFRLRQKARFAGKIAIMRSNGGTMSIAARAAAAMNRTGRRDR
jgi:N-methylhydantoinase A/oxoprolinase/acetone carboxylase beta subunit